jgi:hypothetical protein
MPLAGHLLLLSLVQGALRFLGSPQCPTPKTVEAQLRTLNPASLDSPPVHLVMLEPRSHGLEMQLFDEQGRLLEERFTAGRLPCEEWAKLAAAVLATWEINLTGTDRSSEIPSAAPVTVLIQPSSGPGPAPPVTPDARWRSEIGLAFSGFLAGNGPFTLGGEVLAGLAPPRGAFGGQLILAGMGIRSLTVGDGTTNWHRFYVGLGGDALLGRRTLKLDLGAAFLFGLLNLSGKGYSESFPSSVFDPGIGLTVRGLWRFTPAWTMWAQLGTSFWVEAQEVQVVAGATTYTARVPPVDFSLSLGLSLVGGSYK